MSIALPGNLVLDFAYKGEALTLRVMEILQLTSTEGWSVVDQVDHLALIHYKDEADMSLVGQLRGILVDLEAGAVIADSFGYTPTAVAAALTPVDNVVTLYDEKRVAHSFPLDKTVMRRAFEGVVIRIIWHKGRWYRLTHKKIDPTRSRWGKSKKFLEMYDEAGGPTAEQLFDTSKPYSSTCYDFMIVDPALLIATRQQVSAPYLVLLAKRTVDVKRPAEEVAPGRPTFSTTPAISGSVTTPMIHEPAHLTLAEANKHLAFGYYNEFTVADARQKTGEALIVYHIEDGQIHDVVRVHSPAYDWRNSIRGHNPNLANQFYSLLNTVYDEFVEVVPGTGVHLSYHKKSSGGLTWARFCEMYIPLPLYDETSIAELYRTNGALLTIPEGPAPTSALEYNTRDKRIYLLWLNFVLALPPNLQGEALSIIDNFRTDREALIKWLIEVEQQHRRHGLPVDLLPEEKDREKVESVLVTARKMADSAIGDRRNYNRDGSFVGKPALIQSSIRNLIKKKSGPRLYMLVRIMKTVKAATEAKTTPIPAVAEPVVVNQQ